MSNIEIILPAMGEGIIEATITRWLVEEGNFVEEDDPVVEVATDKVDTEIPTPQSGIISKIFYKEGEIPKVGEVIAVLRTDITETESKEDIHTSEKKVETELKRESVTTPPQMKKKEAVARENIEKTESRFISPFIRFQAMKRAISFNELQMIEGTGLDGRITKSDLNNYIKEGRKYQTHQPSDIRLSGKERSLNNGSGTYEYIPNPEDEIVEMDRTRKLIADHMIQSKRISPHVTSMIEIDITPLVQWRLKVKDRFFKRYGYKLTYTPLIVECTVKALKEFSGINISVIDDKIVKKKNINIGVATALPNGNLIVPVIKNADVENLQSIAGKIAELSDKARSNKLQPSDIKGSTFTITNMGQYNNISGTPIINQPEVAILAVGAIKRKPGVYYFEGQETIGIRDIMVLSLTYDHRVVDGSLGGSFLKRIGDYLENYDITVSF